MQRIALLERLEKSSSELSDLVSGYEGNAPDFADCASRWIRGIEDACRAFRVSRGARFAAIRGRISAAGDGWLPDQSAERTRSSRRRAERVAAMQAVVDAEGALREEIARHRDHLDEMREKVVQIVTVIHGTTPIEKPAALDTAFLRKTWASFGGRDEAKMMHIFLDANLSLLDRLYLLQDVLESIFTQPPTDPEDV